MVDYQSTALIKFLQDTGPNYAAKIDELRDAAEGWLSYIPQTFPHYTRHTIRHSDEVVLQASDLLFRDDGRMVVDLSPLEAFVIAAAAYLHDAGMVVSDQAKTEILGSAEWKTWVSEGQPGFKRYTAVRRVKELGANADADDVRDFLADVELRRLIADFVRRTHHLRSADFITAHQARLGRFGFDHPLLTRTIADVCAAHGLPHQELDDPTRFPFLRTIHGEKLNVRFAAIILRLADLLDLSSERACPLVLNAANPLPPDSTPHWTQYERIIQHAVSPQRVEIVAECQTQEEHRVLQDWLTWLSAEGVAARGLLAGSERHANWSPPIVTTEGNDRTLRVRRAAGATYIPSNWKFRVDPEIVLDRLIHDIYTSPLSFVRELLQNGLDAQRCRMFEDLGDSSRGGQAPTRVEESVRRRYPLLVSLEETSRHNDLTGEDERVQVLRVKDKGIGMTLGVVQDYLLQVGRSFYSTPQFRDQYAFVPTSRFGVGFLSVFGASDHVVVRTKRAGAPGLQLTLSGPRNYLLTEEFETAEVGTEVEAVLRQPREPGELTEAVAGWCRRVEFPIEVSDLGSSTTVTAETSRDFVYEQPDVTKDGWTLAVRAFPIDRGGVEGELYVFVRRDPTGVESWNAWSWARYTYPKQHPAARAPSMAGSVTCINGLAVDTGFRYGFRTGAAERVDVRKNVPDLPITRQLHGRGRGPSIERPIKEAWEETLSAHIASLPQPSWRYLNSLADRFGFLESYWLRVPGLVPCVVNGESRKAAADELCGFDDIVVVNERQDPEEAGDDRPHLGVTTLDGLDNQVRRALLRDRHIAAVEFAGEVWVKVVWHAGDTALLYWKERGDAVYLSEFPTDGQLGVMLHSTGPGSEYAYVLNSRNPLVTWLERVRAACASRAAGLVGDEWEQIVQLLLPPLRHPGYEWDTVLKFLDRWNDLTVPTDLRPPSDLPSRAELVRTWVLRRASARSRD